MIIIKNSVNTNLNISYTCYTFNIALVKVDHLDRQFEQQIASMLANRKTKKPAPMKHMIWHSQNNGPDRLELIVFKIINQKKYDLPCRL